MKKNNLAIILGTRPEIIKLSPVIRECQRRNLSFFILHTNQHFSENMDKIFFDELKLPQPKYNLGINSQGHGRMIGNMMIKIEEVLIKEKPNWVLVQGDTNTILSGAVIGQRLGIKIGHVEAGLRSYDRTMPEEINRMIADHVSDALFCPTKKQREILLGEGIDKQKILVTGNTIVDAVNQNLKLAEHKKEHLHYKKENYFLLTLHRPSNVDDAKNLRSIIKTLEEVVKIWGYPICFPVHPRTKSQMDKYKIKLDKEKIYLSAPVGYLEMLIMEKYSKLILTDSGGLQEEACILKVPCVTLRDNTERPETLEVGSNILAGNTKEGILKSVKDMLSKEKVWRNPFGDGKSAFRIMSFFAIN